jgi:hypothetical protein
MKTELYILFDSSGLVTGQNYFVPGEQPEFSTNTLPRESYIRLYYNNKTREYYEGATQLELSERDSELRSTLIKETYEQRKRDGWDAYQGFRASIVKDIYDCKLTMAQAFLIEDYLSVGYDRISDKGDWQTAYYKLCLITVPYTDIIVESYLERAKETILSYIQANYKPM